MAIQSTPCSKAKARSERSFSVNAAIGITTSGTFRPLRFDNVPPTSTFVTIWSGPISVTRNTNLPSSSNSRALTSNAAKISGCGKCTRCASPGVGSVSSRKLSPVCSSTLPSAKLPTRNLGPCRSTNMVVGRLYAFSSARILAINCALSACSPWLILTRKASAPARNSFSIISGVSLAGPNVANMRTLRMRGL